MKSQTTTAILKSRTGEKGAALITAVLLSLLLLAAGGTLILTTTMTGLTARDSTSEMQAYYAAEAGVARTLEVLRGNVQASDASTLASFKNILCSKTLWTSTSGNIVNVSADASSRFQVEQIVDPDFPNTTAIKCAEATYQPDSLRIRVRGLGPRDSEKKMEIVIDRYTLDYPVDAVVTARNDSVDPLAIDLGDSNVTTTSGDDLDGSGKSLAAYAVNNSDYNITNNVIDGCDPDGSNCGNGPNVSPGDPLVLTTENTPSFLESVYKTRLFLDGPEGMQNLARKQGRYFETEALAKASTAGLGASDAVLTFVDGDLTLGPGTPTGQGTLVVTGTLTLDGNFNFNGVIMVLGKGTVQRSGAGHGKIYGAIYVAKFARTGADTDLFQAPTFDTNGGGSATIQYSSNAIDKAKSVGGHAVKGIREL